MLDMTRLGFEPESLAKFERQILKPYGMVLVTGPTGSGKTNTLYSSIDRVNTPETNIMTAEDPVEFNLHGINQVQMKEQIGLNFAAALRVVPAPGPEHHPGGRDPRLRDGRDRGQGRAHRPPRAVDAAHQRRAVDDQPPDEHGHRAVPRRHLGQLDLRPAPRPPHLQECKETIQHADPGADRHRVQPPRRRHGQAATRAAAARTATTPATAAASGCTKCMEIIGRDPRADPVRRLGDGAPTQGDRGGHDHAAQSGLDKIRDGLTTVEEVVRETVL